MTSVFYRVEFVGGGAVAVERVEGPSAAWSLRIDATDGLVAVDTMPAMPPIALAVSVGARVPEPVRAAVRRAAASLTRDDQAERA